MSSRLDSMAGRGPCWVRRQLPASSVFCVRRRDEGGEIGGSQATVSPPFCMDARSEAAFVVAVTLGVAITVAGTFRLLGVVVESAVAIAFAATFASEKVIRKLRATRLIAVLRVRVRVRMQQRRRRRRRQRRGRHGGRRVIGAQQRGARPERRRHVLRKVQGI